MVPWPLASTLKSRRQHRSDGPENNDYTETIAGQAMMLIWSKGENSKCDGQFC